MDFAYSGEQVAWRDTVRAMLRQHAPVAASRALHDKGEGYDPTIWQRLADLGAHGIHLPESLGGLGFTYEELAIVVEETGAVLLRAPLLPSAVSSAALCAVALDDAARGVTGRAAGHLEGIADGRTVMTSALDQADAIAFGANGLSGSLARVPFAAHVPLVLVAARDERAEPVLAVVDLGQPQVEVRARQGFDLTVPLARVCLESAAGEVLATGPAAESAIEHALLCGTVLSAAEMLGGAQACLDDAVAYAKQRRQFGRTIGSFQAVKHLCAQMLVELELARSAVMYAVWALATTDASLPRAASTAKALANEAYQFLADTALHIHGGMGFTHEHDSHLYLRRAVTSAAGFGDTTTHRELFLAHSGHPSKGES